MSYLGSSVHFKIWVKNSELLENFWEGKCWSVINSKKTIKVSGVLWYLVLVNQQLWLLIGSLDGRLISVIVGQCIGNRHQNLFSVACGFLPILIWLFDCLFHIRNPMNVKNCSSDSLNTEFNQHWQQALDVGDHCVIIDTIQKASPENAATHPVENK